MFARAPGRYFRYVVWCHQAMKNRIETPIRRSHSLWPAAAAGNVVVLLVGTCFLPAWAEVGKERTVQRNKDWEPTIAAFEAADKKHPPPRGAVLFTGASHITRWKSLARDFPRYQVINRGFGGAWMSDVLQNANRIVIPYAPRMVIVQAGGNDVRAGRKPEDVFADFKAFFTKVRAALPETRIAYLSIPSSPKSWAGRERFQQANALIEKYLKTQSNVRYIDSWTSMLGRDGQPRPELFVADQLHLSKAGYDVYIRLIEPYLAEP